MTFATAYETRLIGTLTLASDGDALVGCWFENDRLFGAAAAGPFVRDDGLPVFSQAKDWLARYFAGGRPGIDELPLNPHGTAFRQLVWGKLRQIPYGATVTYGDIARQLERETGRRVSSQAVGGAVGHNPLCVIVPCHRVVGAGGNLTGFGGGLDTKVKLLELEGVDMAGFYRPKRGTAL